MPILPPTSVAPDWVSSTPDEAEELDEPPEPKLHHPVPNKFQRTVVRRPADQPSLLTKAILGQSDDDSHECTTSILVNSQRRRSMASNVSVASTADLTSDTGLTSPCRTNTPSPPIPEMAALRLRLHAEVQDGKNVPLGDANRAQEATKEAPRKRCIQFACAAKPLVQPQPAPRAAPMVRAPSADEAPRRPCIKFVCPTRAASTQNTPPKPIEPSTARPGPVSNPDSPSTPKKSSFLSAAANTSPRVSSVRRLSDKTTMTRPKYLRANSTDLVKDGSQFHEFASGMAREEDWIRQVNPAMTTKLTIYDTLIKENHIRRLGAEAEEEAEQEDAEAAAAMVDDEDEDEDDDDDLDDVDDNDEEEDEDEDDESDGYYTDEETGFAESDDDDEEEDENMILWTPGNASAIRQISSMTPVRRSSIHDLLSDSSAATNGSIRRVKPKRVKPQSEAPDLPDSTDFVCGTLDEDRPLEEAYLSNLTARRNEKLRVIPQDIDPSFPASDPDNDDEEEIYNPVAHDSDGDAWVQGEMEDLHHGQDRSRRRRKSEHASPRKYRSPAPKRHHSPPPKRTRSPAPKIRAKSPAPKPRARSPKPLFGRHSPRRARSPVAPRAMTTPTGSPRQGAHVQFHLAGRPNTTHTKSLPRPGALFPHMRKERHIKYQHDSDVHLRGAIDIVKGLERKRQRRKEKFYQKYCNRARRGQVPERKPQPGRGAERMKELGLLMAGKKDPGNYVISI